MGDAVRGAFEGVRAWVADLRENALLKARLDVAYLAPRSSKCGLVDSGSRPIPILASLAHVLSLDDHFSTRADSVHVERSPIAVLRRREPVGVRIRSRYPVVAIWEH